MSNAVRLVPQSVEDARAMVEAMSPGDRAQVSPEWLARVYSAAGADEWKLGYAVVRVEGGAEVRMVIAHTLERANASARVLEKVGFGLVGEVIDPEDGVVWKWESKVRLSSDGDVCSASRIKGRTIDSSRQIRDRATKADCLSMTFSWDCTSGSTSGMAAAAFVPASRRKNSTAAFSTSDPIGIHN